MRRQTTLRPSEGGKFHAPVEPSIEVQKQIEAEKLNLYAKVCPTYGAEQANKTKMEQKWDRYINSLRRNPWQNEFIAQEFPPEMHGPKSKEVIKDGKTFIVYSA